MSPKHNPIRFTDADKKLMIERAMARIRSRFGLDKPVKHEPEVKVGWEKPNAC